MIKKILCAPRGAYSGVASLPAIIALTILVVAVGVGMATLSISENFASVGQRQASAALNYARAGAEDALLKITRNKAFTTATYTIDIAANGCATFAGCVAVSVSSASGTVSQPKVILSKGQVQNNFRQLQVQVIFDSSLHGEIATTTWQEVTN